MNALRQAFSPVHHGMVLGVLALIFGALWAAYIATHHEPLHGGFEAAEAQQKLAHEKPHKLEMQADLNMDTMGSGSAAPQHAKNAPEAHGHGAMHQHSHSGSLAADAMQRLLRGHIHFMGIGILVIVVLIVVASTSLKDCWKKVFGWTFGLGALLYPPAWILMGFRTVELGPQGAEASVMWLFGPAVALLIGSLIALFCVMAIEYLGLKKLRIFARAFEV